MQLRRACVKRFVLVLESGYAEGWSIGVSKYCSKSLARAKIRSYFDPMATHPNPAGYHTVTPYLAVRDAQGLIDFMVKVFDAKERELIRKPDGQINHAEIQIGDSVIMLGSTSSAWGNATATLYVYVDDADATYQKALDAGAISLSEPANQFYGDRHAGVKDTNGVSWWIATHFEDVPPEELARRAKAAMEKR